MRIRARLLAPVVLAMAACGGGAASGPTTAPAPADVVITAVDGIRWDANSYTAASKDGKVVIRGKNDSSIPHNLYVIATDGTQIPGHIDLKSRGSVETETLSLPPGTYTVICKIPGHGAMKAKLTVT